jgi:hypothetical protein
MNNEYLTWFGYLASAIIAVSMTMNSIVKFRWINLVGASSFALYGILINAVPVSLLNGFITVVNIYYLSKIYSKKEQFETLEVRADNKYLLKFLKFHNKEIQKFFPGFEYKPEINTISFFILRDMNVAGVFLAHQQDDETIRVGLDFVIPQYRDFKNGKYIFHRLRNEFINQGIKRVVSPSYTKKHSKYLLKMGFKKRGDNLFEKRF